MDWKKQKEHKILMACLNGEDNPNGITDKKPTKRKKKNKKVESKVQAECIKLLKDQGWFVIRTNSGAAVYYDKQGNKRIIWYYWLHSLFFDAVKKSGFPDVLALNGSKFKLIEVKRPGEDLRDSQKLCIRILKKHGIKVLVVDSVAVMVEGMVNG